MLRLRKLRLAALRSESGVSLVEVMVAMVILLTVATATASFTFRGLTVSAEGQRRDLAITVANQALEAATIASLTPTGTGAAAHPAIFNGRSAANVLTAWNANSSVPGASTTYMGSDPTPLVDTLAVPISSNAPIADTPAVTDSGTKFSVTTLIGYCFETKPNPALGTAVGDCKTLGSDTFSSTLPATPATSIALIRVIVVIGWTAGCPTAGGCSYSATSLLDPTQTDLLWVSH
jgi:prepilin-type N-terminal cleavage/methylation domain-containing protein